MVDRKELLGGSVRKLRGCKGWTQVQLAEKIGISTNYLSGIERGKENPTLDMLLKVADSLKVEMWEMFDFGHAAGAKEIREIMAKLLKEADDQDVRLAQKILRAVIR